jgi:hypothetical protein
MPGKLPYGWRWVTELDPAPASALHTAEAPALAARDCPPLTSAALQAAARQEQGATGQPVRSARLAGRRHSRDGS